MNRYFERLPALGGLILAAISSNAWAQAVDIGGTPQTGGSQAGQTAPAPTATATPQPTATATATPTPSASPTSTGSVQVKTATGSLGEFLANGQGMSLYLFEADTAGRSNCSGDCAVTWPPLTVPSGQTATAGGDAQNSLLGTITRSDGSTQVTYKGQPLYTYVLDKKPGDTVGEGVNSFGAEWYLVKPDGSKLEPAGRS